MPINSRQKGKAGELEAVHFLNEMGFDTHRTAQHCGMTGTADIEGIEGLHIEVKRNEHLNVENALQQAERDTIGGLPIVLHRKNREEWKVTLRADKFFELWRRNVQDD